MSLVEPYALTVIRLQRQFAVKHPLENPWPGVMISMIFSKSVNSFYMGPLVPDRSFKKLSDEIYDVSGYAL